jgi:hypothetical protein
MIEWFTWLQIGVGVVGGVICLGLGFANRKPNDISMGAAVLVEVLLFAQLVIAIVAPLAGNPPTGSLPEFYIYLISALLMAPLAGFWALVERTRWSTVILGVMCLAIAIMVYRMDQIWTVQVA